MPDPADGHYSDAELAEICAPRPLRELDVNQVYLLHRHLIWSSYQREHFRTLVPGSTPPDQDPAFLASEFFATLAIWNSLLWVVISGFNEKGIELAGPLREDVAALSPTLKDFRNAVFHVSRESHHDPRLFRFMTDPLNIPRVYPVSEGLGALFWNESEERKREGRIPADDSERG
jgi:hypothetical protein